VDAQRSYPGSECPKELLEVEIHLNISCMKYNITTELGQSVNQHISQAALTVVRRVGVRCSKYVADQPAEGCRDVVAGVSAIAGAVHPMQPRSGR
jgi:hypothetical protein